MDPRPDWRAWHEPYDDPSSPLSRRLRVVQDLIRGALDRSKANPIRAVSMCAGQGRDLLPVLEQHPRGRDVQALLVELDPHNAELARQSATSLPEVEVVTGDASNSSAYAGAVPADLVLACGIFGNVSDEDVGRTIALLPCLCAEGATVIWTRHRRPPDLTVQIRDWFRDAAFEELAFVAPRDTFYGVGAHRLTARALHYTSNVRLFTFLR